LRGNKGAQTLEHLIQSSTENERRRATIKPSSVKMLAPVASPPKIICLGLNYRDHAAEQNATLSDEPIIFMKPHTAVIGPDEPIVKPAFVKQLDYEAELALIIGKRGKDITVEDTKDHIFGYTCFNDVSARDIQFRDKQWTRGKSFDTFAPMGPCLTTTDQIGDPTNLWIRTRVNGELRQNSSTHNMVFNVYQIVHELSRVMTLEPSDVIATGTPAGVAFAMKPRPRFLSSGDLVEIEIQNIGMLRNKVVSY
jgi:2-keto-4-pentenoate hydratase/2-oxohepta-3-ene-1,7-dioic acid hydratase in catechol pathway